MGPALNRNVINRTFIDVRDSTRVLLNGMYITLCFLADSLLQERERERDDDKWRETERQIKDRNQDASNNAAPSIEGDCLLVLS